MTQPHKMYNLEEIGKNYALTHGIRVSDYENRSEQIQWIYETLGRYWFNHYDAVVGVQIMHMHDHKGFLLVHIDNSDDYNDPYGYITLTAITALAKCWDLYESYDSVVLRTGDDHCYQISNIHNQKYMLTRCDNWVTYFGVS